MEAAIDWSTTAKAGMNLWFRLIWLLLTSRLRPRLDLPADV